MINRFEDIDAWKEGMRLAADFYKRLSDCRDFGFRDCLPSPASCL